MNTGTVVILLIIILAVIAGVLSLVKDYKHGEFCDPKHRDCAHCSVKCTSNPNYYGLHSQKKRSR